MILFLRNRLNETILDLEVYVKGDYVELSSVVCIDVYSKQLLSLPTTGHQVEFINTFSDLQELRGWLWEKFLPGNKNKAERYNDVIIELRVQLKEIANRYDLLYVED